MPILLTRNRSFHSRFSKNFLYFLHDRIFVMQQIHFLSSVWYRSNINFVSKRVAEKTCREILSKNPLNLSSARIFIIKPFVYRSRSSNKVPPGAVNLERSYQICQAVIQNSPNRDALRGQLRPPPALLTRPTRAPRPPPPVLVRQLPAAVMPHAEVIVRWLDLPFGHLNSLIPGQPSVAISTY